MSSWFIHSYIEITTYFALVIVLQRLSPANPLKDTSTVHSDGTVTTGGTTTMSGFTIIEVDSQEAALSIAKSCPFLDMGGSLEVSELMQMPGQK